MLQHEFEDLIGRKVEREEYIKANALYMSTDLDKAVFCKEWDCIKDSKVLEEITNKLARKETTIVNEKNVRKAAAALILDAINAEDNDDLVADKRYVNAARMLISDRKVALYRIEHDYALDATDKETIKPLLG